MNDTPEREDFASLYRRAFAEYRTQALWNCECMAGWKAAVWQNGWKGSAVPLTQLQSHVLRLLAAERSPGRREDAGRCWPYVRMEKKS